MPPTEKMATDRDQSVVSVAGGWAPIALHPRLVVELFNHLQEKQQTAG